MVVGGHGDGAVVGGGVTVDVGECFERDAERGGFHLGIERGQDGVGGDLDGEPIGAALRVGA